MNLNDLLRCPLCNNLIIQPVTLRCGHSLCHHHHRLARCPVSTCDFTPARTPHTNIPSSSTVAFYPAPHTHAPPVPEFTAFRPDVTISKVIALVAQYALPEDTDPGPVTSDADSDTESLPPPSDPPSASSSSAVQRRARSASPSLQSRPRKRRRRVTPSLPEQDNDLLSHLRTQCIRQRATCPDQPLEPDQSAPEPILARFGRDLLSELTCEICYQLFYKPITTPCQHTFCYKCLHRSLDHSPSCPICRKELPGFSYFQDHPENKIILSILLKVFPTQYAERGEALEAEERDTRFDTPIFVCQLSFPGMPTLLHFFEPRYRLMLRRCLQSPRPRFGMIMPPKPGGASTQVEYGTMLEIRSVQMLSDGRSIVETWGSFRFRLLERATLDGYMVGRIERIDDLPEDPTEDSHAEGQQTPSPTIVPDVHPTNAELMDRCRSFLDRLQRGTAPWVVQRLNTAYGQMPTDASSFSYWVALVLPIDEYEKAKLLPIRSTRLRLLLVVHWIEQLNNNWYWGGNLLTWITLLIGFFLFHSWGNVFGSGGSRAAV